jgi:hypothetical protein
MVDTPGYDAGWVRTSDAPDKPPPPNLAGWMGWVSDNLVPTWWHGLLSVFGFVFLAWVGWILISWAIIDAAWTGAGREACLASVEGACWAFVRASSASSCTASIPSTSAGGSISPMSSAWPRWCRC